jgi:hypothetical protein
MTDDIEKLIKKFEDIDAGTYEPESTPSRNPEHAPLYGGISGLPVSVPEFVLCDGLVVRETYAHVMAPYLMAFAPPAS